MQSKIYNKDNLVEKDEILSKCFSLSTIEISYLFYIMCIDRFIYII